MLDRVLDELPYRRLYAMAKAKNFRVALIIDTPPVQKSKKRPHSHLDSIDVWEGKPGRVGSRLITRASLVGYTLDEAAEQIVAELAEL